MMVYREVCYTLLYQMWCTRQKGVMMALATYKDILREYYRKNVHLMDLDYFCNRHGITYHRTARISIAGRNNIEAEVRYLTRAMFSGVRFDIGKNSAKKMEVTPGMLQLHALDDTCIVIPSLRDYVGAYRFIPSDDIPTAVTSRMGYFRCPSRTIAVSLALWLRHPRVIEAIRNEFKQKRRLKEMTFEFLGNIPVPEVILQPDVVKEALRIDEEIAEHHRSINALTDTLEDLTSQYV